MAAHTPTDAAFALAVQPDQPPSGRDAWLREMARAVNQIGAKTTELATTPGVPGPAGPAGPAGPPGPTGATGPGISGLVPTRVPFAATTSTLADDSALNWDNTNKRLGIGTATPGNTLQVSTTAGTVVGTASFVTPSMANNQQNYLGIGSAVSGGNGFSVVYNHNSASGSRYLSIQAFEQAAAAALSITADGNVGVGALPSGVGPGLLSVAKMVSAPGYQSRAGTSGAYGVNAVVLEWRSSAAHFWVDTVDVGAITITCDYRIKESVAALPSTWDKVKALRPISYTIRADTALLTRASPDERWGFIAHELQQTLLPTAATGHKDAPNLIQSPDLMAICAALTRTLQEAMARIETLEAGTR